MFYRSFVYTDITDDKKYHLAQVVYLYYQKPRMGFCFHLPTQKPKNPGYGFLGRPTLRIIPSLTKPSIIKCPNSPYHLSQFSHGCPNSHQKSYFVFCNLALQETKNFHSRLQYLLNKEEGYRFKYKRYKFLFKLQFYGPLKLRVEFRPNSPSSPLMLIGD